MEISKIITLLSEKFDADLLQKIRREKHIFNEFKQQTIFYTKNITKNATNNNLDANLMGFALLCALNFADNDFISFLTYHFNFDDEIYSFKHKKIKNIWITFAKAYICIKNKNRQQAKYILWRIFVEVNPNFLKYEDYVLLTKLFEEFEKNSENYYLLLSFCVQKFDSFKISPHHPPPPIINSNNDNTIFKIKLAEFELVNSLNPQFSKYNFAERSNTNLQFLETHFTQAKQVFKLADICYAIRDKQNCLKYIEKAILTADFPIFNLYKYKDANANVAMNPNFTAEKYLLVINEFLDILENAGEKPFIECGTLLGLYRDGTLMSWDYDADIGILIDDINNIDIKIKKLQNIFKQHSDFSLVLNPYFEKQINKILYTVSAVKNALNVGIDIEFFYKDYYGKNDNKYYVDYSFITWELDNFYLIRKQFNNRDYWIPNDPDYFLTQFYGDWKKPNSLWDSKISCPNITKSEKCISFVFWYGMKRLFRELSLGNYKVANFYYKELQRWEYPFTSAMKMRIENHLAKITNL